MAKTAPLYFQEACLNGDTTSLRALLKTQSEVLDLDFGLYLSCLKNQVQNVELLLEYCAVDVGGGSDAHKLPLCLRIAQVLKYQHLEDVLRLWGAEL